MPTADTAYDPDELAAALLRNARGDDGHQAALTLLAEHDYWLRRIAYHHPQFVTAYEGAPARLDWVSIGNALQAGDLYASSSQQAVLRAALSLQVYGYGVMLGLDGLRGLDATNTAAVLRAIATANGHRALAATIGTRKADR